MGGRPSFRSRCDAGPAWSGAALIACAVTTVAGVLALCLVLLQPWASRPGIDDSPVICPVQGPQASVLAVTLLLVVAGGLGLLGYLLWPTRAGSHPARRMSER
jgi:hypothetical protein